MDPINHNRKISVPVIRDVGHVDARTDVSTHTEPAKVDVLVASNGPAELPSKALGETANGAVKGPTALRLAVADKTKALTDAATRATVDAIADGSVTHHLVERFGEGLGMTLGLIVTEALALAPSWNAPVVDAHGKPVAHVDGADRIGDHDIRKRHEEVVGPKVAAYVATLAPGVVHDLLAGLGEGATAAPGTSYRIEASIADAFKP